MKDFLYILLAVIGLALVGAGLSAIQQARQRPVVRSSNVPFPELASLTNNDGSTIPSESLPLILCGYICHLAACAIYATSRGRSPAFGLLGLLSPVAYVLLPIVVAPRPPQSNHSLA